MNLWSGSVKWTVRRSRCAKKRIGLPNTNDDFININNGGDPGWPWLNSLTEQHHSTKYVRPVLARWTKMHYKHCKPMSLTSSLGEDGHFFLSRLRFTKFPVCSFRVVAWLKSSFALTWDSITPWKSVTGNKCCLYVTINRKMPSGTLFPSLSHTLNSVVWLCTCSSFK